MSDELIVTPNNPHMAGAYGDPNAGRFDARQCERVSKRLLEQMGITRGDGGREDAGWTGAFARQLEYRMTQTYDVDYSTLKARTLIPVDNSVPAGAEYFTYHQYDAGGDKARIVHNYSDDAPQADIKAQEFSQRCFSLTSAYSYSVQDMRAAAFAGIPLEAKKALGARMMIERKIEDLAASGTPEIMQPGGTQQAYGLYNAPNVALIAQVSTGTWAAQYAADVSADHITSKTQIVADLNAILNGILTNSKGEYGELGDYSVVFPTPIYAFLRNLPRSVQYDSNGQSLLEYVVKTCGFKDWAYWNRADKANAAGNAGRIAVYKRDPDVLRLVMPQEFEQFAPQPRNLSMVITCHARSGAVEVTRPLKMAYMDGPST